MRSNKAPGIDNIPRKVKIKWIHHCNPHLFMYLTIHFKFLHFLLSYSRAKCVRNYCFHFLIASIYFAYSYKKKVNVCKRFPHGNCVLHTIPNCYSSVVNLLEVTDLIKNICYISVSYTHLDVYKRQHLLQWTARWWG